ncbi:MAG: M1 family aminopeptidase, partial [Planctomycetota bacterium]
QELHLLLNDKLEIKSVSGSDQQPLNFKTCKEWTVEEPALAGYVKCCLVDLTPVPLGNNALKLKVSYGGKIYEPVQAEQTLRFIRGGSTSGVIGAEGIYLHGGTFWYPTVPDSMPLFKITTLTPEDWRIVGQDRLVEDIISNGQRRTTWESQIPADSLTLVGGRYVVTEENFNGIRVATYFSPANQPLAQEHLEASKKFLKFFSDLLVPYPYKSFSVVENFFETGYGMPSYTLLGPMVIKRKHIDESGLGHEILHCWWGNYIYVDDRDFNWCEGLTTYLANYYYLEAAQNPAAVNYRRDTNVKYSTYVNAKNERPISTFAGKTNEADEQIGYGKLMMVFHQMRRLVGDDNFFLALRQILTTQGARRVKWSDFQSAFESASPDKIGAGRPEGFQDNRPNLDWFTKQWITRPALEESGDGVPVLALDKVEYYKKPVVSGTEPSETEYFVSFYLKQQTKNPYQLFLPVVIETAKGKKEFLVETKSVSEKIHIPVSDQPVKLTIDPDYHNFRKMSPEELSPCLNATLNSGQVLVIYPGGAEGEEKKLYQEIGRRVVGMRQAIAKTDKEVTEDDLKTHSLFILGGPKINKIAERLKSETFSPAGLTLDSDYFAVGTEQYRESSFALLASVHNPFNREKYLTIFTGLSTPAIQRPARLLFFYGWKNYFIFRDGQKIKEDNFVLPKNSLEYQFE